MTAPDETEPAVSDSCMDLISYRDAKPEPGPSAIADHTFEISQVRIT